MRGAGSIIGSIAFIGYTMTARRHKRTGAAAIRDVCSVSADSTDQRNTF
jgi:hypothetical protein